MDGPLCIALHCSDLDERTRAGSLMTSLASENSTSRELRRQMPSSGFVAERGRSPPKRVFPDPNPVHSELPNQVDGEKRRQKGKHWAKPHGTISRGASLV